MKLIKKLNKKMEYLFGMAGLIIVIIFLIWAMIVDGNYSMFEETVSSLGTGDGKTLFSIGFIIAGSLGIPFYIKLEKSLVLGGLKDLIRRIATAVSIISCVAIALIGVIPDENFPVQFDYFHGTATLISFVGTSAYIAFFSISMLLHEKYKLWIPILGLIVIIFLFSLIFMKPFIEWLLTISIFTWIFATIIHNIFFTENEKYEIND
ncbi:hypothetical protein LCGC14_1020360 [marine sediment metagenome]|uniref:DUF998 domain-containing protein n=1 Tax=marine sediment metagenome TaxID=412755 RepID=A0A0F9N249_9ZZZZ